MDDSDSHNQLTWRYLTDAEDVRHALEQVEREPLISLDTETYWNPDKSTSVSLVQIAAPLGDVLVIDALVVGVEPLRALIESPDVRMVAHNARFDEGVLQGAGLSPHGFIDTLSMARMALSLASYSLASVSEHLLGLPLDKSLQNSNWRRRPLTRAQLEYAARDARVTLQVYEELRRLLVEQGRFELALRASTLAGGAARREPGKERKRRRAPALPPLALTAEEKRLVLQLKKWRLERAHAERVPAYMICPDKTLEHLARERPSTLADLIKIHGLGESKIARFGEDLLRELVRFSEG